MLIKIFNKSKLVNNQVVFKFLIFCLVLCVIIISYLWFILIPKIKAEDARNAQQLTELDQQNYAKWKCISDSSFGTDADHLYVRKESVDSCFSNPESKDLSNSPDSQETACQVESQMEKDNKLDLLDNTQKTIDFITNCHNKYPSLYTPTPSLIPSTQQSGVAPKKEVFMCFDYTLGEYAPCLRVPTKPPVCINLSKNNTFPC